MDSTEQATAYAQADFSESNQLFVSEYLRRFPQLPAQGQLLDLGCGPADICIRMAAALPGWNVSGVDAGPNMLATGQAAVDNSPHSDRVHLKLSYLPDPSLPQRAYQGVISNSLLHHLPEPATLWQTLLQVAAPGAAIMVMDLYRPASEKAAWALVNQYSGDEPEVLRQDFFHSLCAAYTVEEISAQLDATGLTGLGVETVSDRHWVVSGRME